MKIIEFRIFMPLTLEENLIGQLWSFAEVSRVNTGGGEGVEILDNELFELPIGADHKLLIKSLPEYEDYDAQFGSSSKASKASSPSKNPFKKSASKENFRSHQNRHDSNAFNPERSKSLDRADDCESNTNDYVPIADGENGVAKYGQYTHKLYMIASKLPWFIRKLLPKDSTILHEKSWNMYPIVKTVLHNEYFRNNFRIELDTITRACPNGQAEENVHNLTPEQLEKREIVVIDISDPVPSGDYKEDEDPTLFKSKKTGRGPLFPGWYNNRQQPVVCCYKLVSAEIKLFGLQSRSENYLKNMYKQLFTIFHRQVFCWMDKWYGLTIEDVRKIEYDLAKLLVKKIDEGELSRNRLADSD